MFVWVIVRAGMGRRCRVWLRESDDVCILFGVTAEVILCALFVIQEEFWLHCIF